MPIYDVTLSRAYRVRIKARNETIARRSVEFFLRTPVDDSRDEPKMRKQYGFSIEDIEMVVNDAIDAEVIE